MTSLESPRAVLAAAACLAAACAVPVSGVRPRHLVLAEPVMVRAVAPDPTCWRCHEKALAPLLSKKTTHAPFRLSNGCGACHGTHDGPARKAGLVAAQAELCRRCHAEARTARKHVHSVIAQDGCTACHSPHASDRPDLLGDAPEALCEGCHDGMPAKHGGLAVDGKRCLACHDPHTSAGPKLLRDVVHGAMPDCSSCHAPSAEKPFALSGAQPGLCFQCHDGVERETKRKVVHAAVTDAGCTSCHAPHGSDEKKLLLEPRPALCLGCHPAIQEKLQAKVTHPPARQGRCGECHVPHGADQAKLLAAPAARVCERCHADARTWRSRRSVHDPVRCGECASCHDGHGGGPRLLVKQGGALCAGCHDVQATEAKKGAKGHPPVAKGECATCHVPHASDTEELLSAPAPNALCARCHAETEQKAGTRLHEPFATGRCSECHVAHGGGAHLVRAGDPCRTCHTATEKRWASRRLRHAPVAEGRCPSCHEPHAAPAGPLLRKQGRELCLGCHGALAKRLAASGAVVHAAVSDGVCGDCHEPHAADVPKLLSKRVPALCVGCHDLDAPDFGRAHGGWQLRRANCTACHDPHVSSRASLVPDVVHPPFEDRECDTCHIHTPDDRAAVRPDLAVACKDCHDVDPKASRHEPVRRGRCAACHALHASPRPHLMVETGTALCDRCHDRRRDRWKKIHAEAGAEGNACLDCHDAHLKKDG